MTTPRGAWSAAGAVAGVAGLAVSHAATMVLTLRSSPLVAVAEMVIQHVPGVVAERAIQVLGSKDKPVLVVVIFLLTMLFAMWAGRLAERSWWKPVLVWVGLAGIGLLAVLTRFDASSLDFLPVAAGLVTWIVVLSFITEPLHDVDAEESTPAQGKSRRSFLIRTALLGFAGAGVAVFGQNFGARRRHVEETRRLLNLPVTDRPAPGGANVGVEGMPPWRTPIGKFYKVHTAVVVPTVEPQDWSLRIHGMVDREITLSYQELVDRPIVQRWMTLNCVSNPVGGPLIGNAWWSGVPLAQILAEAGVSDRADAVLQTSHDGWTCGTPLEALTDPDRQAMLAIAMNGEPLPIDHGFPVRTLVPGLYGYVSACKWVVDMKVTTFDQVDAYWTKKGWSEHGPVKIASRIDMPQNGDEVEKGVVVVGGHAWKQHTGIAGVEIAVDGGAWRSVELGHVPNVDTWVQWRTEVELEEGDHTVRVRAIGAAGEVQTGVERDVLPDGATGWHEIQVSAT
ncbi:molybdopterin-dependent oxidoreductase [Nocardioides sp. JQ2195]|uniref:molybdopterin-dependent oxidoreductase n=1 Tax=Nocardioides sp. JQ2195 TaxID=2592334 RepID=UPI00143EDBBB|nr:molybdopterin-dependent oxidoreductase [Nocardioides sp. JQ2195]QIX25666.1 molybdopterin-dependent oxidoreductase [Nocardioides sp. JQ2195]